MTTGNMRVEPQPELIQDEGVDLGEYLVLLRENRNLIGGVTALFFIFASLYVIFATPIFKADALVQIEEQGTKLSGVDELTSMMGTDTASSVTEIEIIKSRNVVGAVVDRLHLDVIVEAVHLPVVGSYLSAKHRFTESLAEPWLGLDSYAWGGEQIDIDRFEVANDLIDHEFTLQAAEKGGFLLLSEDGETVLNGKVGEAASSDGGEVRLFVSQLRARPGTCFRLLKLSRQAVISELQQQLRVSEKGKKTGILSISLEGTDRERISAVVHNLAQSYMRQNVERRSEESERMLEFIQEQLPLLRTDLNTAEQALNNHREAKGTIDLSYESQNLIKRITELETQISSLRIERAEMMQKLTESHPLVQGLDEKMRNLFAQRKELEKQLQKLPETELESVKLSRDVTVANELYMLLLNKSQELKVSKAGTIGNVRIIDDAVAGEKPVKPKKALIVAVSLLLGFIVGVMSAAVRKALNKTVEDPAVIEKQLGYSTYAEVPFSTYQAEMDKSSRKRSAKGHYDLLAHAHGDEQVVESLRSLRTSLQFALMEAENNIISITGPAPEIGKSFISANFAYLMAESGKNILLVDADLRKGHLNHYFKFERSPGLSEYLTGEFELEAVTHKAALHENLDVVTTGVYPPNPSELLMSDAFQQFLETVKGAYDLIIIDTPPILAVTDAAIVGQYVGTNFMVVRSGQHHLREIQTAFKRFEQNGIAMKGVIFNGVELMKAGGKYGYGYKYYSYQYDYK